MQWVISKSKKMNPALYFIQNLIYSTKLINWLLISTKAVFPIKLVEYEFIPVYVRLVSIKSRWPKITAGKELHGNRNQVFIFNSVSKNFYFKYHVY